MKQNQFGRSMIEMLGVLAIIGVLSVGGIAGYSKAMEKWKVNKLIQEYNDLIFNLLEYRADIQKSMTKEVDLTDFITSANIKPNTWNILNTKFFEDSYGNWVNIRYRPAGTYNYDLWDSEGYIIDLVLGTLSANNEGDYFSNNFNQNICFEVFNNIIKPLHNTINGVTIIGGAGKLFMGDNFCSGVNCINDLPIALMKEVCASCDLSKRCNLTIIF